MKKHLLSLFAAAAMLFATSCSEEELTYENGNKQSVTFKVAVEGAGVSSRTIADGENHITIGEGKLVNKLFYAVYETGKADCLWEGEATVSNGLATVVIPLVNGLKYDLVFLAYNDKDNAFGISKELTFSKNLCGAVDLTNLTLKSGLVANQEAYDAFYHVEPSYVTNTNSTTPVKLKRMFAQLNVATTDEDLRNAAQLNVNVTRTALKLKNVPNQFNARTGQVGKNRIDVPFAASAILKCADNPDKHEILAVKKDGENKYFNYLAMAYVLADEGKSLHDVNVSFYRKEESTPFHTRTIPSVPLQRQYRTNITGNILTQQEAFSISLDTTFVNREYNESVGDVVIISEGDSQALQAAIENAQPNVSVKIQLEGNIVLGENNNSSTFSRAENEPTAALKIEAGREITIDLNGFTISQTKAQDKEYSMIQNNGVLTIKDSSTTGTGKISYADTGNGGNYVSNTIQNSGTLTIESGIFENNSSTTVATNGFPHPIDNSGTLTINGGTFTNKANYSSMRIWCTTDDNTIVTINGGRFNGSIDFQTPNAYANKGTLTINDGTFNADSFTECAVRLLGFGADVDEMNAYIKGGNFNGEIALRNWSGSEFNSQVFFISGGTFSNDPSEFVDDDYKAVQEGNVWTIQAKEPVVKIGETGYTSLQKAVDAVQDGETIVVLEDLYDVYSFYGREASFTLDLNGKTLISSTNKKMLEFDFKDLTGAQTVKVDIKNGKIISGESTEWTIYVEDTPSPSIQGVFNLSDLTIEHNMPNYWAVVAGINVTANAKNVNITTSYGGGFYAAGGNIIMDDCSAIVKGLHTRPWNSMAFGICANGKMTINSGNYSAEPVAESDGNNQGTSHGIWCGGVMSSGGELVINGGTFTNDNYGDNASATYARECIMVDAGGKLTINGGTFNALNKIIYLINNIGNASLNPVAYVNGGDFSADPTDSGGYGDPILPEGKSVIENDGRWTIDVAPVAKIGETEYKSLVEAAEVAKEGETITVLRDVTLSEALTLPAGIIFNGNGKQINGTILAGGDLSIMGDAKIKTLQATNGGTITIEDGKTLTLDNFSFGSKDNASAEYEIKGGTVKAKYGFFQHGTYNLRSNFETGYMYYSFGSDITVYGTLHSKGQGDGLDYVRGKLTIAKGGKSIHDKSLWVGQPASWGAMEASLTIEEGGYVQANSLSVYEGSSLTYYKDADLKYNSVSGVEFITKSSTKQE